MSTRKQYLFIIRRAAVGYLQRQESIDMMLALSAFDHKISVLFMEEGICQLINNQQQQLICGKNHSQIIKAFPLYDIEHIYVQESSLNNVPVKNTELVLQANPLTDIAIRELMQQQDVIIHG